MAGAAITVVRTPADGTVGAYIVVVRTPVDGTAGAYMVVVLRPVDGAAGAYMVVVGGAAGADKVVVPAPGRWQFVHVELSVYGAVRGAGGPPKFSDSHDARLMVAATWIATSVATPIVIVFFHRFIIRQLPSC